MTHGGHTPKVLPPTDRLSEGGIKIVNDIIDIDNIHGDIYNARAP